MITAITPCLDEIRFLPGWLANVRRYADKIVVVDTGSTDGSREYLERQSDVRLLYDSVSVPYRWDEGRIRNRLLDEAGKGWIVKQDCDELLGDELVEALPFFDETPWRIVRTRRLDFWSSFNHIRVSHLPCNLGDLRFYPYNWAARIWKNHPTIRFRETGNHAPLEWCGTGKHFLRFVSDKSTHLFYHYHYSRLDLLKPNDNRRAEIHRPVELVEWMRPQPKEVALYWSFNG